MAKQPAASSSSNDNGTSCPCSNDSAASKQRRRLTTNSAIFDFNSFRRFALVARSCKRNNTEASDDRGSACIVSSACDDVKLGHRSCNHTSAARDNGSS